MNNQSDDIAELTCSIGDYRDVELKGFSVAYADPPYKDTKEYGANSDSAVFDHEEFYKWCEEQTTLVIISEYSMPEDRFVCVAEKERTTTFSATNNNLKRVERLFVPKHQVNMYRQRMGQLDIGLDIDNDENNNNAE